MPVIHAATTCVDCEGLAIKDRHSRHPRVWRHYGLDGNAEYVAVQEQHGTERLVLCCRGNAFFHGQPTQKCADVGRTQLLRMSKTVKRDVPSNPMDIRIFGASTVMARPDLGANLIHQPDRSLRLTGA